MSINTGLNWFIENQEKLVAEHYGRHIVVVNGNVVEDFDSELSAYLFGKKQFGAGNFEIYHCMPGQEVYTTHLSNFF